MTVKVLISQAGGKSAARNLHGSLETRPIEARSPCTVAPVRLGVSTWKCPGCGRHRWTPKAALGTE